MKKIGILHGRERTFPEAFCAAVNARGAGVVAEPCALDVARIDRLPDYDVIIDRISHEVPFYAMHLKQAALEGCAVVNNPFWRLADDKYLGTCLAHKLGIAVPRTLILPQHSYVEDITPESLTNLRLVDWEEVGRWLGWPVYIKPATGGGWKSVSRCSSVEELIACYDRSGTLVMMVQEEIRWEAYARLLCIGREHVWTAPWDPTLPHHERYQGASFTFDDEVRARMEAQAVQLNEALGYDMNTVEFAIRDGVPYAIDFTNTSPDFDRNSLTAEAFEWVVEKMADLALRLALDGGPRPTPRRWQDLL